MFTVSKTLLTIPFIKTDYLQALMYILNILFCLMKSGNSIFWYRYRITYYCYFQLLTDSPGGSGASTLCSFCAREHLLWPWCCDRRSGGACSTTCECSRFHHRDEEKIWHRNRRKRSSIIRSVSLLTMNVFFSALCIRQNDRSQFENTWVYLA